MSSFIDRKEALDSNFIMDLTPFSPERGGGGLHGTELA